MISNGEFGRIWQEAIVGLLKVIIVIINIHLKQIKIQEKPQSGQQRLKYVLLQNKSDAPPTKYV
jgi:hypothetical protein